MTDSRLPMGFTITPYGGEPTAAVRMPLAWASRDLLQLGSRVVAAGLALSAAWAPVQEVTQSFLADDGALDGGFIRYRIDGWGHTTVNASPNLPFAASGSNSGANFGVLLCAAAAGLLVAAALDRLPRRFGWQPSGSLVAGLANAFLLAITLCEVVTGLPYRRSAVVGVHFHFGLSPWLGGIACLIAALSCLPARPTAVPETDVAYWRG